MAAAVTMGWFGGEDYAVMVDCCTNPKIPEWKWETFTMDFVTKAPKTFAIADDTIWVIDDRLTKSAIFIPIRETDPMDKLARILTKGDKVGEVAYKLELPEELSRVHNTFHVSNLKKCYADEPLAIPLDGLHFDDKLQFVEEPIEIMECEVKRLKRSSIPLVKVRWNSKQVRRKSRTSGLSTLRKVGSSSRVESSNDASLGAQEDASKKGRKIKDLDANAEVTLVNETQEMNDDNLMFDTCVLEEQEIEFEKVVEEPIVSVATTTKSIPVSAAEVVTTASVSVVIPTNRTLASNFEI
ncbi:putative reverse transcriptase domain-containing protein [Tanacetum coccineum]